MTAIRRPAPPIAADPLLRQIDQHLSSLRFARRVLRPPRRAARQEPGRQEPGAVDLATAEDIAAALRRLVGDTAQSSAEVRAKVRAAVHHFLLSRVRPGVPEDVRVINRILVDLGRGDLVVGR